MPTNTPTPYFPLYYSTKDSHNNQWDFYLLREKEIDDSNIKNYWEVFKNNIKIKENLPTYQIPSLAELSLYIENYNKAIIDPLYWYSLKK